MGLVSQAELFEADYTGLPWHKTVADNLTQRLTKPTGFPCTFGVNAFARDLVLFAFIETLDFEGLEASRQAINDFVDVSLAWDKKVNTAQPLLMCFSLEAATGQTPEDYHAIAWRVIQHWHDHDPDPWPDMIPTDAHEPYWSMCYRGMQIFINVSNPAHINRNSRNLGPHMVFVINPRERFDVVAGASPEGQKVRDIIRKRVTAYDKVSHCPQLSNYLYGDLEWWQYGIIDENRDRQDKCPFHYKAKD